MSGALAQSSAWVGALARKLGARLIETHISWVLLLPGTAYKVKKPIRTAFLDYTCLQDRQRMCEQELRVNWSLAKGLYLGVVSITGPASDPQFNGSGPLLDYAVRMRRFSDGALFSERLQAGALTSADVDELAALLGRFHAHAPPAAPTSGHGSPAQRQQAAASVLAALRTLLPQAPLDALALSMDAQAKALAPLWQQRLESGCVRECHGDLHLDNIGRGDLGVFAFDAIEFDDRLRWIDVLDDVAFAVMDFCARGRRDFAFRLLNGWLDWTGQHEGMPALRYAVAYRALVRALAAAMKGDAALAQTYVDTARRWDAPGAPTLLITHGLPGSGKTFQSQRLLEQLGAVRLRSDVERKRLFGLDMLADSRVAGLDIYTTQATDRVYVRLFALARIALASGLPTVIDAAFLRRAERDEAAALAATAGVPFAIVSCQAPAPVLRERLLARRGDASEADLAVLDRLAPTAEPLGPQEPIWQGAAAPDDVSLDAGEASSAGPHRQ